MGLEGVTFFEGDMDSMLHEPVSVCIYGDSGSGKSLSMAQIANKCCWIVTHATELRSFASWLKEARFIYGAYRAVNGDEEKAINAIQDLIKKDEKLSDSYVGPRNVDDLKLYLFNNEDPIEYNMSMPKKVIVIDEFRKDEQGNAIRVNNEVMLKTMINLYLALLQKDPTAFSGLVIDTITTFTKRMQEDMRARMGDDAWGVGREMHSWLRWLCKTVPQISKKSMVTLAHSREPEFEKNGTLKYIGGPSLPTGTMTKPFCSDTDFVFHRKIEEVPFGDPLLKKFRLERSYLTEAHPHWCRKARDARVAPVETGSLRKVFAKASVMI